MGGSLIIANHIAQFSKNVTLLTAVGKECPYLNFIRQNLESNVRTEFTLLEETNTLTKKRYVLKDGKILSKLFETYLGQDEPLTSDQTEKVIQHLEKEGAEYDQASQ